MQNTDFILDIFKKHNINITKTQAEQFELYFNILIETNKVVNLTAITEFNEVVSKHFVDCALCSDLFSENANVLDIGSGAGFPGIVLKIMRPDLNITLVDSLNKRINFLNNVILKLNLSKIKAIHSRIQDLKQIETFEFDYATARAVAPLNILLEYAIPYLKIKGQFIALKSLNVDTELKNSQNALKVLNTELAKNLTLMLHTPTETQTRNILLFTKLASTPPTYPRNKNKIELKPL